MIVLPDMSTSASLSTPSAGTRAPAATRHRRSTCLEALRGSLFFTGYGAIADQMPANDHCRSHDGHG
jgi:hypothetical protein